ncbi:hypothetical protein ABIB99_007741 [Bradyrhizobium sp. LA6.1]|uniref:SIR2 family protein n=1 Tax=Bradyrhizobium sp. LA6.1 TaxID=3156378 RepID=UPI003392DD28
MLLKSNERPLVDVLAHSDTVLFIGSGVSIWSGLPNWNSLLAGLIAACVRRGRGALLAQDALARGDLLDAADKLGDQMTSLEIASTLREDLEFTKCRPHEIHSLITNLGPQRFVTTNFDTLIEQQLGLEGRLGQFRTVTNRQVAELADIQKASANHFIFKPHGDLGEAESLVLSSSQYDRILFGASNLVKAALETLFVSRPILFLGYGLRDPDMLMLLRSLKERYNGNAGELWAIVADASAELRDYYWRQYRLQLVGYQTTLNGACHDQLIGLLRTLSKEHADKAKTTTRSKTEDPERDLIRYAARLIRPTPAISFPLRVTLASWHDHNHFPRRIRAFHQADLSSLLEQLDESFILQGRAGSGKSFALADRISRAGRELLDWCLAKDERGDAPQIPILLDARLYKGSFTSLLAATVPTSIDLARLSQTHTIVLFVDSLDEMPSEYLDSGQWRIELEILTSSFRHVILQFGTRRADLASDPTLPVFTIDALDEDFVQSNLAELGRTKEDVSFDLFESLKTPFVLTLARRLIGYHRDITSAPALFSKFLARSLETAGVTDSDRILALLSELANEVLTSGYDTFPINKAALKLEAKGTRTHGAGESRRLIDRLVSVGILISEIDDHVRFIHRSITEFLAAIYLARSWRINKQHLSTILNVRRWDNAVAWAATLLEDHDSKQLLGDVYAIDRQLAATIANVAEIGKQDLWEVLIDLLITFPPSDDEQREFIFSIEGWPISEQAIPKLQDLTERDDELGGWAAAILLPTLSDDGVCMWIDKLGRNERGYNFLNFFGPTLGKHISSDALLEHLLSTLRATVTAPEDEDHGNAGSAFTSVAGDIPKPYRDKLLAWSRKETALIRGLLCSSLQDVDDDISVQKYLTQQLDRGLYAAVFGAVSRTAIWQGSLALVASDFHSTPSKPAGGLHPIKPPWISVAYGVT